MLILIFIITFILSFLVFQRLYPVAEDKIKVAQLKKVERAAQELDNIFLFVSRQMLLFFSILLPLLLGLVAFLFTHNIIFTGVFIFIGLSLPAFLIKIKQKQRQQQFNSQIIDALMLMSASLKAGLSLTQAFEELIEEMPAPISQEFGLVIKELNMGISFEEALGHLKKRMRSEDLDLIITAISIARETGGQLPAVFSKLVFTIKERQTLRGKVAALTIQAKLQGLIMSLLPVIFVMVVYRFNPEHFEFLLKDPLGKILLIYAVFSQIVGILLIMKFSKVEI
ncbi:MAG: type II secretion system F family protein [Candidatus Omnitrophica bacterium]|nr:type II secretion system F family protein [Candidatus Omnitrophota bacterium]